MYMEHARPTCHADCKKSWVSASHNRLTADLTTDDDVRRTQKTHTSCTCTYLYIKLTKIIACLSAVNVFGSIFSFSPNKWPGTRHNAYTQLDNDIPEARTTATAVPHELLPETADGGRSRTRASPLILVTEMPRATVR